MSDLDCGDSSCLFAADRAGMRTQGGCRCLKDLDHRQETKVRAAFRELTRERDEARETAHAARRIADKHAATVLELRAMVERLAGRLEYVTAAWDRACGFTMTASLERAAADGFVTEARDLLERTKP